MSDEFLIITLPHIDGVTLTPESVAAGENYTVSVSVSEMEKILEPLYFYAGEVYAGEIWA